MDSKKTHASTDIRSTDPLMKFSPKCTIRSGGGDPATHDLRDGVSDCPAGRGPLESVNSGGGFSLARRIGTSMAVLAACLLARWIPLPTISADARAPGMTAEFGSLMSLGLRPLIASFVLVELAAWLNPAWGRLRTGSPGDRAKLNRAAVILGIGMTLLQAFVFERMWRSLGDGPDEGGLIRMTVLVGVMFLLVGLAGIVDREGLGAGWVVVLTATFLAEIIDPWVNFIQAFGEAPQDGTGLRVGLVASVASVGVMLWMFRGGPLPTGDGTTDHTRLGRPACGLTPITLTSSVIAFFAAVFPPVLQMDDALRTIGFFPKVFVCLSVVFAGVWTYLYHRPVYVADAWRRLYPLSPEGIPSLKRVLPEYLLFIAVLAGLHAWVVSRLGPGWNAFLPSLLLLVGIGQDLLEEFRFRRQCPTATRVWEIHQMYAVAPTVRMLESQGISVFAAGSRFRALMQFFGPYAPVRILVPADVAQRARSLVESRWFGREAASVTGDDRT